MDRAPGSARELAAQMADSYYLAHGYAGVPDEYREPFVAMLTPVAEMVSARLDACEDVLAGLAMRDAEARGELGAGWPEALPHGEPGRDDEKEAGDGREG